MPLYLYSQQQHFKLFSVKALVHTHVQYCKYQRTIMDLIQFGHSYLCLGLC